jgi:hypothetical protein
MKKTLLALTAAAVLAGPAVAHAQQQDLRTTLAVLPCNNGGMLADYAMLGKGLQALLLNDLVVNGRIRIVERDEIQRILDEQKLGSSGQLDPATIIRVGKLLGAKYMLKCTFMTQKDGGDQFQMTISAFNTETSEVVYSNTLAWVKATKFMDLVTRAAADVNTNLKLPQLPAGSPEAKEAEAKIAKAKTYPMQTTVLYARALEARDSGNTTEARTLFNKVLTAFPDYEPARKELDKLPK